MIVIYELGRERMVVELPANLTPPGLALELEVLVTGDSGATRTVAMWWIETGKLLAIVPVATS